MIASCPSCAAKFRVDDAKVGPKGIKLRCTKCQTVFPVTLEGAAETAVAPPPPAPEPPKPAPTPPPRAVAPPPPAPPKPPVAPPPAPTKAVVAPPPPPPAPEPSAPPAKAGPAKILVAHDSYAFCKKTEDILKGAGHRVILTHDAEEVLEIAKVEALDVIIMDVMLPGILGFELAQRLKSESGTSYIKVMLAVSIFDPSAYKRGPQNLYGADALIESHHLEDQLLDKINRLLGGGSEPAVTSAAPAPTPPAPKAQPTAPAASPPPVAPKAAPPAAAPAAKPGAEAGSPEHLKAQRLARTIVSDILLYNQDKFAGGLKSGNIRTVLQKDIKEGADLYLKRVSPEIRSNTDYLNDELEALFDRKRKELGI